jgi:hypothetical protein
MIQLLSPVRWGRSRCQHRRRWWAGGARGRRQATSPFINLAGGGSWVRVRRRRRAADGAGGARRAAHVAIQPGVGPQWEYYPEVWRCKCAATSSSCRDPCLIRVSCMWDRCLYVQIEMLATTVLHNTLSFFSWTWSRFLLARAVGSHGALFSCANLPRYCLQPSW